MKQTIAGLALGLVAGTVSVLVVLRLRKKSSEEDFDALRERLASQLSGLEQRVSGNLAG